MIVGIRPEHFDDAALVADRPGGHTFRAIVDVLESVGSEYYAHFTVPTGHLHSTAFAQRAQDSGTTDARRVDASRPVVARLGGASRVRQGREAELWFDTTQIQLLDAATGRHLLATDEGAPSHALPRAAA